MSGALGTFLVALEGVPLGVIGLADCLDGVIEGVTFNGFATEDAAAIFTSLQMVPRLYNNTSLRVNRRDKE